MEKYLREIRTKLAEEDLEPELEGLRDEQQLLGPLVDVLTMFCSAPRFFRCLNWLGRPKPYGLPSLVGFERLFRADARGEFGRGTYRQIKTGAGFKLKNKNGPFSSVSTSTIARVGSFFQL